MRSKVPLCLPCRTLCSLLVPGYLEFLESSGRYKTSLLKARYEYEQAWNPDWEANKEDALSVSVCDGGALDGTSSSNVLL